MPTGGAREERSEPSYPPYRFLIHQKSSYILKSIEDKHYAVFLMFELFETRKNTSSISVVICDSELQIF